MIDDMPYADKMWDNAKPVAPTLRYAIIGARRSGTTYLGNLLWNTGCLGKPFEYGMREVRGPITLRIPPSMSYWDFLEQYRTTSNGVFGYKVVAPEMLSQRDLGIDKIVYVKRTDLIEQAVSLTLAQQTKAFFSFKTPAGTPTYSYEAILNNLLHGYEVDQGFDRVLTRLGVPVLNLTYDTNGFPADAVQQVGTFLGVTIDPNEVTTSPVITKQATTLNAQWVTQFQADLVTNGCSFSG